MHPPDLMLYEEEFRNLDDALRRLWQESNARAVYLLDADGRRVATAGDFEQFDTTSLASLPTGGLARLVGERELSVLSHETQLEHVHVSVVARRAVLVVVFDDRSSLGLVRLRVKRAALMLDQVFEEIARKEGPGSPALFSELTDDALGALFAG